MRSAVNTQRHPVQVDGGPALPALGVGLIDDALPHNQMLLDAGVLTLADKQPKQPSKEEK